MKLEEIIKRCAVTSVSGNTAVEIDAITNDMNKSAANAIRDLGRIVWVTSSCATGVGLFVNAALILL